MSGHATFRARRTGALHAAAGSLSLFVLAACLGACAPDEPNGGPGEGSGGAPQASGGSSGSGGATATGGNTGSGTGGTAAGSGGAPAATGGSASATGGSRATGGGTPSTGGRGGGNAGGAPGSGGGSAGAGATTPVTVFIASDSTASSYAANAANMQAGWGQMLPMYFNSRVTVSNQAIGGRTSRRFINEGRLTTILNAMKPGDYLLVQFGTNDGNTTAVYDDGEPYFVNTTDFQGFMNQYIDGARSKQGIPVLVTPPPRASCTGDSHDFGNGLAGYSAAMKTVAAAKSAALVDLNAATLAYVNMIGCIAAKADFYLLNDGTHFQQNGARLMAGFVADGIVTLGLPLAAYRLP